MDRTRDLSRAPVALDIGGGGNASLQSTVTPASPVVRRRVATLERESSRVVSIGESVNAPLSYLGIAPLFNDAMMFSGESTDWIISPGDCDELAVIPRKQRGDLARLDSVGVHFPMLYLAHEVPKGNFPGQSGASEGEIAVVPRQDVEKIVGPVPMPISSMELADQLGDRASRLMRAIGRVIGFAGAAAAAPFLFAGQAAAALLTLDPIVVGAIPAVLAEPGAPAAWYLLARWEW